jgi:GDPmannose 4,6-dehydratase
MKKVAFITGISGQDGSILAEYLLKNNYVVFGLVRPNSNIDNISHLVENQNLNIVYGDLMNDDLLRYILTENKFDEVYNLASQSNVRKSYENPILTFNVTLIGTIHILDSIKKYSPNSKIFQASSSSMFGYSCDGDGYQRENTPFKPISPYASSKLFAHNICQNYRENEGLYISNGILYNHESTKSKSLPGVINTIISKAVMIKNGIISDFFIPNVEIKIDWGHAEDYVEAMWFCLQQNEPSDYIISSGETYSIGFICEYIFSKLDMDWKDFIKTNSESDTVPECKGDNSKIKSIGWKPKYTIYQMLDQILLSELNKNIKK